MLLSIHGGSDLGLFEINEAAQLVQEAAHPEANIIFGAVIDDALGDEVRVTVIAAGFDGGAPQHRADNRALGTVQGRSQPGAGARRAAPARAVHPDRPRPSGHESTTSVDRRAGRGHRAHRGATSSRPVPQQPPPPRTVIFDENDDLDVPDFLK